MKNRSRIYLSATLVMAAASLSCQEKLEQPPPLIRPVRYQKVSATGGLRTRTFTGAAKAGIESKISFKVSGTLQRLMVGVGDSVHEGQLIAEIDPRDYELQVEETAASLAHARALVRSIQKKLELAQLQVSYTRLESPIDGAVAEVPVEVNENVRSGQPIVVLNAGARPEVEVAIPEVLIREILQDMPAWVSFDAIPNKEFAGRVTEVGVTATEGLKTYPVTVLLDRPDARILPGMAAEVSFRFGSGDEPLRYVLPPHAVGEDRAGKFVYVVTVKGGGRGTVKRRPVVVGELVGEESAAGIEVLEGLQDGEMVVTVGVSRIEDGQEVILQERDQE